MPHEMLTLSALQRLLRPRPADGHKGTFGHALIVAGRYGMAGASVLAARACMRSGVGKTTLHIPRENNTIVQISAPEVIVHHDADAHEFTTPVPIAAYDAMAIGPGLGTSEATCRAVAQQLTAAQHVPCVVDADALNILALHPEFFEQLPKQTILTPHPAEYRRMAGDAAPAFFAAKHRIILVLKGHPTRIFTPEGQCYESPWGNSGMGTAGSGDVLTGIIVALLAQGYSPAEAAVLGVSLHALSGDHAVADKGEHSLIASDLIDYLPSAFQLLEA